jgi:hypothetical protein
MGSRGKSLETGRSAIQMQEFGRAKAPPDPIKRATAYAEVDKYRWHRRESSPRATAGVGKSRAKK